jgi:dolichol-phosphate mannosyltransferase
MLAEGVDMVVVDDGSSDGTAEAVRQAAGPDLHLIEHVENRGLGEAIRSGMLKALSLTPAPEITITMDSDNTHAPELIGRMVAAIRRGYDVVIASRYRPGSQTIGLSWHRRMLSWGMSKLYRAVLPIEGVRDYSCGYRAYRTMRLQQAFEKWRGEFVSQSGFSCMVDILLKLERLGASMTEVPMTLHYDNKRGKSKMHVMRNVFETLVVAVRGMRERYLG